MPSSTSSSPPLPDPESTDEDRSQAGRPQLLATVHPSAVLRAPDREAAYQGLLADLRLVTEALERARAA